MMEFPIKILGNTFLKKFCQLQPKGVKRPDKFKIEQKIRSKLDQQLVKHLIKIVLPGTLTRFSWRKP